MAEQDNNSLNDQPVLVEDNTLAKIMVRFSAGAAIIIAVVLAVLFYRNKNLKTELAAIEALSNASGAEQLQQVAGQYPNTPAGELALTFIAADRQQKQDYAGAAELYANFLQEHAKSQFAAAAQFAQAENLQAAGKKAEAQAVYQTIVSAKPASPYAGGAAIALARIYLADNNVNAARQTLTDFISREVNSNYLNEANRLLRELPQSAGN